MFVLLLLAFIDAKYKHFNPLLLYVGAFWLDLALIMAIGQALSG